MAFLDSYSGTRKVPLDDDGTYWVELRECLPQGAKGNAERAMIAGKIKPGKDAEMELDTASYRELMVLGSIIAWNLDDPDGTIWPVTLESVRRLPGIIFDKLHKIVDETNEPKDTQERRQFPAAGVDGNPDGQRRTTLTGQVLARTTPVATDGPAPGGFGTPSMA